MNPRVEPDREQRAGRAHAALRVRARASTMFANRLRKNLKSRCRRGRDVRMSPVFASMTPTCPSTAFAIDLYGNGERHVSCRNTRRPQPSTHRAARARRDEALSVLEEVLALPLERVHARVRDAASARGAQYEAQGEAEHSSTKCARASSRFLVNFTDYLDTGLFLDHRLTRALHRQQGSRTTLPEPVCLHRDGDGLRQRARRHRVDDDRHVAHLSRLGAAQSRAQRAGRTSATNSCRPIVCSGSLRVNDGRPRATVSSSSIRRRTRAPSACNSEFDVQRDHVGCCAVGALLEPGGVVVFSNNYRRFKLDRRRPGGVRGRGHHGQTIPQDFARNPRIHQCFVLRRR